MTIIIIRINNPIIIETTIIKRMVGHVIAKTQQMHAVEPHIMKMQHILRHMYAIKPQIPIIEMMNTNKMQIPIIRIMPTIRT